MIDHILTLQQSLVHYEHMLSQSQPTYLTELRLNVSKAKSGADKAIVFLSIIAVGVLCVQTLIGEYSYTVIRVTMITRTSCRLVLYEYPRSN